MKKLIRIKREGIKNKIKKVVTDLSFSQIFTLWILFILVYSALYYGMNYVSTENGLYCPYLKTGTSNGFSEALYFSIITATTAGYGDITPLGYSRIIAVTEILIGFILFGLLISKIVSFKQDIIMDEIYEISLDGKVKGLRSSLYLFRADLTKMIELVSERKFSKRMINNLWTTIYSVKDTLVDIEELLCTATNKKNQFTKTIGHLQIELTLNSITNSLDRLYDFLIQLDEGGYDWRTDRNKESVTAVLSVVDIICDYYKSDSVPKVIKDRIKELQTSKSKLEDLILNPKPIYSKLFEFLQKQDEKTESPQEK